MDNPDKPKLNIETIIEQMIDKVIELGHTPHELWLTDEAYNELLEKVSPPVEKITYDQTSVLYEENPIRILNNFRGLDIVHSNKIRITWIK